MEPIGWFFAGIIVWTFIIGIGLFLNYRFHEWQKMKRAELFPKCGGRDSDE
jgi:hypothetical protein